MGYTVGGMDLMPAAVEHAREIGIEDVHEHDLEHPWPFAPQSASAVVMLDVLEHIADPGLVLRNAAAVLEPSGKILITVPAYPWLFGDWDQRLGHYRRYTRELVHQHVREAGLQLQRLSYWNAFSLFPAIAVRTYQRWRPANRMAEFPRVSPLTNRLLMTAAACERHYLRFATVPCGLSLIGVISR